MSNKKGKTSAEPKLVMFGTESGDYKTTLSPVFKKRKPYEAPNPKHIVAFIPGTIDQIFVKTGDKVVKGDKLMVLYAMKMNNELVAPFDGTIKSVNVKSGEGVAKNHILIEFK